MKNISGWIGVGLVFISLIMQLYLMIVNKQNNKISQFYFLFFIQTIIIFAAIFWIIYAFKGNQIYWQTGISNIIIEIFTILFFIINIKNKIKSKILIQQKKSQ